MRLLSPTVQDCLFKVGTSHLGVGLFKKNKNSSLLFVFKVACCWTQPSGKKSRLKRPLMLTIPGCVFLLGPNRLEVQPQRALAVDVLANPGIIAYDPKSRCSILGEGYPNAGWRCFMNSGPVKCCILQHFLATSWRGLPPPRYVLDFLQRFH